MDNLPEGAVQVTKQEAPPPSTDSQDFEGLDLDAATMKHMILGTNPGEVTETPVPETTPEITPTTPEITPETTPVVVPPTDDQGIPEELLDKPIEPPKPEGDELSKEEQELLDSMEDKQKEAFIAMRQELKTLKQQNEFDEEGKKALEVAQNKLSMYNLAESPEFKQKYVLPIQAKKQEIVTMAKQFGGNEEMINRALKLPLKERVQHLNDNMPEISGILTTMMGDMVRINGEMVNAIQQHQVTKKQLEQEAVSNVSKEMDASMTTARELLMQSNHFLLKEAKDSPEWNAKVQARMTEAKAIAATLDQPAARAEILLKARMADDYRDLYLTTAAQLRKIVGHTKNVSSRKPGIGTTTTPTPASGSPTERPKGGMSGEDVGALLEKRDYSNIGVRSS